MDAATAPAPEQPLSPLQLGQIRVVLGDVIGKQLAQLIQRLVQDQSDMKLQTQQIHEMLCSLQQERQQLHLKSGEPKLPQPPQQQREPQPQQVRPQLRQQLKRQPTQDEAGEPLRESRVGIQALMFADTPCEESDDDCSGSLGQGDELSPGQVPSQILRRAQQPPFAPPFPQLRLSGLRNLPRPPQGTPIARAGPSPSWRKRRMEPDRKIHVQVHPAPQGPTTAPAPLPLGAPPPSPPGSEPPSTVQATEAADASSSSSSERGTPESPTGGDLGGLQVPKSEQDGHSNPSEEDDSVSTCKIVPKVSERGSRNFAKPLVEGVKRVVLMERSTWDPPEERMTERLSRSFNTTGPMQTLDNLDNMLTNQLFESHGLADAGRPSFGTAMRMRQQGAHSAPGFPASTGRPQPQGQERLTPVVPQRSGGQNLLTVPQASWQVRTSSGGTAESEPQDSQAISWASEVSAYTVKTASSPRPASSIGEGSSRRRMSKTNLSPAVSGMDALRKEHEAMLVVASEDTTTRENHASLQMSLTGSTYGSILAIPDMMFWIFGIVPPSPRRCWHWYTNPVILLLVAAFVYATVDKGFRRGQDVNHLYHYLSTACLALGGLLGVALMRRAKLEELIGYRRPLELYATSFGFVKEWKRRSIRRAAVVAVLCSCAVLSKAFSGEEACLRGDDTPALLGVTWFALAACLLASLVYCQIHVCAAMELAIDKFCLRLFQTSDFPEGIAEWNVLQALLRRCAHTVEACILASCTTVLGILMVTAVEIFNTGLASAVPICLGLWAGWVLPLAAMVFYAVFCAAAVTEKCGRVPALVNSWDFQEDQMDHERQYAVQYIIHSAAGFYVKGVRVNATWALKATYFFGVVVFTVITQTLLRQG